MTFYTTYLNTFMHLISRKFLYLVFKLYLVECRLIIFSQCRFVFVLIVVVQQMMLAVSVLWARLLAENNWPNDADNVDGGAENCYQCMELHGDGTDSVCVCVIVGMTVWVEFPSVNSEQ